MRNDVSYLLVSFLSKDIFDIVFLDYINEQMSWFIVSMNLVFCLPDKQLVIIVEYILLGHVGGHGSIDLLMEPFVFGGWL